MNNSLYLSILFCCIYFNVSFCQTKEFKLKQNELLCTKVVITSGENRVVELTDIFKSKINNDFNLELIKYIDLSISDSIVLNLLTPCMISINRIGYQTDTSFRLILFELNDTYFTCFPRTLEKLKLEYNVLQKNLIFIIDNKDLKNRIKRKDWYKTMIEFKYSEAKKKYIYSRHLMPKSATNIEVRTLQNIN